MKHSKAAVIAVVLSSAVVSSACGGASSSTSSASPTAHSRSSGGGHRTETTIVAPPDSSTLQGELLTSADLPSNWTVTAQPGTFGIACLAHAKAAALSTAHATVVFVHNATTTTLTATVFIDTLAYFDKGSTGPMATIGGDLNGCGSITAGSGSSSLKGSFRSLSFPEIADQSSAWQGTFTSTSGGSSVPLNVYVVAFRKGMALGMVAYITSSTPSMTAVQGYARAAAARVTS